MLPTLCPETGAKLVGKYLAQQGFRVSAAENATALRRLLERSSPDLIVLDVMMPGEDGLSVCRHVRGTTSIPIIFLTAMSEEIDRIIGLELGGRLPGQAFQSAGVAGAREGGAAACPQSAATARRPQGEWASVRPLGTECGPARTGRLRWRGRFSQHSRVPSLVGLPPARRNRVEPRPTARPHRRSRSSAPPSSADTLGWAYPSQRPWHGSVS